MFNRLILVCLFGNLSTLPATAAEEDKATPAQVPAARAKSNENVGRIAVAKAAEAANNVVPKKNAKWSNTSLDLTHCLNRDSNTAIIKCVE